ncbi:MAG: virulence-associated E family protein, partial [Youngiibacter sp.]|nr:virulence-associated E family protein [Youngiibacter sp.]
ACGKLMNAFDLVRFHKYHDLDKNFPEETPVTKLPSYKSMTELAVSDERVKLLLAEERKAQASSDFTEASSDWEKNLEYEPRSTVLKNNLGNLLLILKNDSKLKGIRYNRLANQIYGDPGLPWPRPHQSWRDADTAQLVAYVDRTYGTFSSRNYELAITKVADDRAFHPIKEYLDILPPWDGVCRVDTLLIEYFGADDTKYTRTVTRKTLVAAVARIYHPGVKYDSMLVLNGQTDLGKSTLFARLAGEWFSDSLNFTDMGKGKDAAEKIQGVWIVEIPELAGLSKMDVNNIKGFLSRQDDQYRPSYGRSVESHPRQCILVGSTNAESSGFLRDTTGNRRFWVVRVHGSTKKGWDLPESNVPQIWAEAKYYWTQG